ncbi:hypothetical protein Taro_031871, partial [Colocasia esculenta]|nr:hypothetical protein [Colocasia esculenta]
VPSSGGVGGDEHEDEHEDEDQFLRMLRIRDMDVGAPPKHYTGKSLEDPIASVQVGDDSFAGEDDLGINSFTR